MKKIIAASLVSSMLFGITTSAMKFEEKCIMQHAEIVTYISGGVITGEEPKYGMPTMDFKGYSYWYWDYSGKCIGRWEEYLGAKVPTIAPDEIFDYSTEYYVSSDSDEYKLLPKKYAYVKKIDNNEYIVQEDNSCKSIYLLIAKGIIGEALYTDIKLNINGAVMPCYNVDGYVVIKAEDLGHYGFDVIWDEKDRKLRITRNPDYYRITDAEYDISGVAGTHYSDIYGTDINVSFNGKRVNSYSINGEMLIKPEEALVSEGISFDYHDDERMLYMSVDGLEQK